MSGLVLGPLVRYVDHDSATIWVETADTDLVTVTIEDRSWSAPTFAVHGHHYALVEVDGLEPGTVSPYAVTLGADGGRRTVWPPDSSQLDLPPSVISTLKVGKPPRLAFGSCRTSVKHDRKGNRTHGVDSMRAYALAMAGVTDTGEQLPWPDMIVFLGDQVYADETTAEMQEFISSRRDIDEPPGKELKDFEEYAHLYSLAWSDPANRWLLSTLPSTMIFDDHDIRDDWNTSAAWREEMEQTEWWHGRIVAGLASYWVYQHLGNLSAKERADDEIWQLVTSHEGPGEPDLSEALDRFADRVDQEPESYRWSYSRDLNGSRLVVVDSRAARVLEHDDRQMLDEGEMAWLDTQLTGDVDHLFIGTSLPFLLPPGLQHLEAFSEALTDGAWGRAGRRIGETLAAGRRPRALGRLPGVVPQGGRDGGAGGRGGAGESATDSHLPLRRRAPQLRLRGHPTASQGSPRAAEPGAPGGVLTDPQPAAALDAVPHRSPGVRRGRSGGRAGCSVHPRPRTAVPVVEPPRTVVRQQPGHRRRDRHGAGAVVGQGRRPQGIPAPAAARTSAAHQGGRRAHRQPPWQP